MSTLSQDDINRMTVEEYLEFEHNSEVRHEYWGGMVYSFAGASERHNLISSALNFVLYSQMVDRPCKVFSSDMRVQVTDDAYYYPDVVVVCGQDEYRPQSKSDILLNPTVIFEILSPSTEDIDRGRKFKDYRALPSLQDYLLVSQDRMQIEHYKRQNDVWVLRDFASPDDTISLASIDCEITLKDVYHKVTFDTDK